MQMLLLLIVVCGVFVGLFYFVRWVMYVLALNNIPPFALRTDGEIKAILEGKKCVGYLMAVENYLIDPWGFDIFKGSYDQEEDTLHVEAYLEHLRQVGKSKTSEKKEDLSKNEEYDPAFVETKLKLPKNADGKDDYDTKGSLEMEREFKEALKKANRKTSFEKWFKVALIGLPPYQIFTYQFRWLKYSQKKARNGEPSDEVGMQAYDETVDSLFFRFTQYGIKIPEAETAPGSLTDIARGVVVGNKIQVKLELVFETETRSPQKTLFRTAGLSSAGDWLSAVSQLILDQVIRWVGSVDWDTLLDRKKVSDELEKIRDDVNKITIDVYGQEVKRISVASRALQNDALQTAIDAVYQAQLGRDAKFAEAAGTEAIEAAPLLGRARGYDAIAKIPDGAGVKMKIAESIGEGGIKVVQIGGDGGKSILNLSESLLAETPKPSATGGEPAPTP